MYTKDDAGKRIRFPHTGSVYRVVSVDETAKTLTFGVIGDLDDRATETFADLRSADAQVLR